MRKTNRAKVIEVLESTRTRIDSGSVLSLFICPTVADVIVTLGYGKYNAKILESRFGMRAFIYAMRPYYARQGIAFWSARNRKSRITLINEMIDFIKNTHRVPSALLKPGPLPKEFRKEITKWKEKTNFEQKFLYAQI